MDRSLWLLLFLRSRAWLRRWTHNLRSLKGMLLALVGSVFFLVVFSPVFLLRNLQVEWQVGVIQHYGAFGLFVYCMLQVLLSAGDRAVYYTPGEVGFLFSGPYRPRQILLYKIVAGIGSGLMMTPLLTMAFSHHARNPLAAAVGLFLAIELLFLFSVALGLIISTVGAMAFNRLRKLLLYSLGALALAALTPLGQQVREQGLGVWVDHLIDTRAAAILLTPFQPFVMTFTAGNVWPELVGWASLAALVDAGLVVMVLLLNARFYEASASASARIYARLQRAKRAEPWAVGKPAPRYSLPMPPFLWGIGPNVWRQLTTASRSLPKLIGVVIMFTFPLVSLFLTENRGLDDLGLAVPAMSVSVSVALFAPALVGFDFRLDYNRMEDLKTLPIPAGRLALGQIMAPVLILSAVEWTVLAVIGTLSPGHPGLLVSAGLLAVPLNLLLLAIENLYFLWYPFRMTGFNAFDFQAMGRQMLLVGAKMVTVGIAAVIASGVGAAVYFLTGYNWVLTVAAAWVVVLMVALAVVPLLGQAFLDYDLTVSQPE